MIEQKETKMDNVQPIRPMQDGKYITFKRTEFNAFMNNLLAQLPSGDEVRVTGATLEVQDAVVIRRQDVFAPPALDAYANLIEAALQIARDTDSEEHEQLVNIADYFHQQAAEAWVTQRKLPD